MKRFLIAAAPRSGTKYIADLLNEIGVNCHWENLYHIHKGVSQWPNEPIGESSWLAIGYLNKLPEDVVILHQIRNPQHVFLSQRKWKIWYNGKDAENYEKIKDLFKGVYPVKEKDYRLMNPLPLYEEEWWITNKTIECYNPIHRYKIEDIDTEIYNILKLIEFEYEPGKVEEALQTIQRDINTGCVNKRNFKIQHEDTKKLAEEYGY